GESMETPPQPSTEAGLEELISLKRAKVDELRARGIEPYPARSRRTHNCAQAALLGAPLSPGEHGTEVVACAGRLVSYRDMGKTIFGHLQDFSGKVQLYFKKDALTEEAFALIKKDAHAGD